jgi:hypothetical protein
LKGELEYFIRLQWVTESWSADIGRHLQAYIQDGVERSHFNSMLQTPLINRLKVTGLCEAELDQRKGSIRRAVNYSQINLF